MSSKALNILFIALYILLYMGCTHHKGNLGEDNIRANEASNINATKETKELIVFLNTTIQKGIMVGHQDDLIYGNTWFAEKGSSDIKRITGDYPAVAGWDLGKIETGSPFNIDSVPAALIVDKIIEANALGIISTISWHANNPLTGGGYNDTSQTSLVNTILPDSLYHTTFSSYLDHLSDFFLSLKDAHGNYIPVIFRPYMSYNKPNDYWWGSAKNTPNDFIKIWRKTVTYLREEKNVHHLLYAYSVYAPASMSEIYDYYPGDDYVDIVGVDLFFDFDSDPDGINYKNSLSKSLGFLNDFAIEQKKIPSITCTGMEGIKLPNYFTKHVYSAISSHKLSYILFWRNAWNMEEHYYIPVPGHPASDNFIDFANKPNILLLNDIKTDQLLTPSK